LYVIALICSKKFSSSLSVKLPEFSVISVGRQESGRPAQTVTTEQKTPSDTRFSGSFKGRVATLQHNVDTGNRLTQINKFQKV
jgi:hypothetical protein